ncbi:SusC/RagA family TonB-linked outer membrane protein [Chitinophaga sp. G-6-1-13]|uniref:SusC/RagA family TonB-linked outer membrane protein n=1 Tax=Chitinophaga fulva TaxID=2728842 RepID=A0A848GRN1_9BACT|nr:SusC/RagA family TonB-linked outer membrane protein [Chitinophaga fulva]NML40019.1 SusC/RagA family TonB-linked outer membrane protein [Chitinophaga fulva]
MKSGTCNNVLRAKCFVFLLAGLCCLLNIRQAFAQDVQTARVTLKDNNRPLKEVFREIEQQTGLTIEFRHDVLDPERRVSITVSREPAGQVLDKLLKGTGATFVQRNKSILIVRAKEGLPAVTAQVSGTVSTEEGEPLPGANVLVKGGVGGVQTDGKGHYKLEVAPEAVLLVSHTGFETRQIPVNNKQVVDIRMNASNSSLNEVVVTALNMKRNAKSLGYSVATLDGSKVNTVQTPNLISALSGKVAGVDVGNIANGVAGTKRVIIRGASSLTGNTQPLWVIDGIPINSATLGGPDAYGGVDYGDGLTGINPDDIESISILKGNAAAALYGSLASNGVILVTTKTGKSAKGKMNVEVSSSLLMDKLVNTTDFQYVYGQSGTGDMPPATPAEAFSSSSWGAKFDGSPSMQFDGQVRPFSPVKDNYERFFNTGSTITNTVALTGNTSQHNYRISLSDLRNKDIVPNAKFRRTSINTKLSSTFGKLNADVVLNYTQEKANNRPFIGGNNSNLFYSLAYMPGSIDIETLKPGYNPDGSEFSYANGISNPFYVVNKTKEVDTKNRLTGAVNLKYAFTDWLYARGRITRDYYSSARNRYIPEGNMYTSFPLGQLEERAIESAVNNYELIMGVEPLNAGKFSVNGFVGANTLERLRNDVNTSGNSFVVPGVYTFNNLATKQPSTSKTSQKTNSLFGSVELSYNKYLYLTLTGRNDWFSTLPLQNNNLFYPSASLSFVFSDAFRLPSLITFGKFRASTAQVSGDTGPGQLDLSYSLTQSAYGSSNLQYIGTTNVPNKNLKPLLSSDYELGLEMDFLQGRIGFDVAYYNRNTRDDIVKTAVSRSTGYRTALLNVGRLQNNGVELLVKATPVKGKEFSWNMTATFSQNNSKVVALGDGVEGAPVLLASAKSGEVIIQLEEGERYGGIYGYKYLRNDKGEKVYDDKGYPLYTSKNDFLANGVYDQLYGLGNTFSYRNFSLYCLLDAKFGASIYSETNAISVGNGRHKMTLVGREDGIVGEGVNQKGEVNKVLVPGNKTANPPTGSGNVSGYYQQLSHIAEEFIYDASFVKLREVSLAYRFAPSLLSRVGINSATFSLVARNLFTLYKRTENVDPESSVASGNAQGIERLVYPVTRNYGVTLKLVL